MKYKERKKIDKVKEEILIVFPSFINQLILLLNSGVVLQEAMLMIVKYYEDDELKEKDIFIEGYICAYYEARKTGKNILYGFNNYCQTLNIKELTRVARILVDGNKKGIDLSDKLAEEANRLNEQRKRIVTERIRLAESKMSFPLGLLLIALIIIAAAPAMMQMYI